MPSILELKGIPHLCVVLAFLIWGQDLMLNVIHIENGWEKHFSFGKLWPSLFLGGEWNRAKTWTGGRQMIPYNSHFSPSIAALLLCLVSGIGWNSFKSWFWLIYVWCYLCVTAVLGASLLMMEVIAACGWILADACNQFWSGQGSQKSPLKPFDLSTQK